MTDHDPSLPAAPTPKRWQPLGAIDRRVVGVLAEKSKTTPDVYPMSLNAIVTGCNQKSNRDPVMNLEPDDVENSLERLREVGAVVIVSGSGRVERYRHALYDWLDVEKEELAVMTELLLRGAQTEGELRGRAARMDPIPDLSALRPILQSLREKNLIISLTAEGRGHVVSHNLYLGRELEQLRARFAAMPASVAEGHMERSASGAPTTAPPAVPAASPRLAATAPAAMPGTSAPSDALRREVDELRATIADLRAELEELRQRQQRTSDDLHDLKRALGA